VGVMHPSSGGSSNYRGSSSSRQSSNYGSQHNDTPHRSREDTTRSIRRFCGFFVVLSGAVVVTTTVVFSSVLLASNAGILVFAIFSGIAAIVSIVFLFHILEGRRVALLYIGVGLIFVLAPWPAAYAVFVIGVVVAVDTFLVFAIAFAVVRSRTFAVVVAAIPLVGAMYYVPTVIEKRGLVATPRGALVSPATEQLLAISVAMNDVASRSAVVTYGIRGNRLYADIAYNGAMESVVVPIDVSTRIPWLERNVNREIEITLGDSAPDAPNSEMSDALKPIAERLQSLSNVVVADGTLLNYPHSSVFAANHVMRSVSLDAERIRAGMQNWISSRPFRLDDVGVVNALPRSEDDLQRLGFDRSDWHSWEPLARQFDQVTSVNVTEWQPTKANVVAALETKKTVVIVVAHSDGVSLFLPNGETFRVSDLESAREAIRANAPDVFLFGCDTARITETPSIAHQLLELGAASVIAPVTKISATDALGLFAAFLGASDFASPLTVRQAFESALARVQSQPMEIWIAEMIAIGSRREAV
jgi:hypothetical protein